MIPVLILAALGCLSWCVPARYRQLSWLAISIGALYALQTPGSPVDFATLTLSLALGVWWIVHRDPVRPADRAVIGLGVLAGLAAAALRGAVGTMAIGVGLAAVSGTAIDALVRSGSEEQTIGRQRYAALGILAIVLALLALKTPIAGTLTRAALLPTAVALPSLSAFGFSYIAFRLIHILIDYRNGRLPALSLSNFALYIFYFPALSAGPIDRVTHFQAQASTEAILARPFDALYLIDGGGRIARGLFKKFIIADSLAYFAVSPALMNALNVANRPHPLDLWLALYAYALYIYFDFSGYSDIAIGIAQLMGVRLPENFKQPYTSPNITTFWNRWHMTLSGWYRDYVFTPLSRTLLRRKCPPALAAFAAQISTMILIGLWHGVSLNYVLWGAWHGIGLFVHQRLLTRIRWPEVVTRWPFFQRAQTIGSILFTFHFVALGWVFFALTDLHSGLRVLAGLFGIVYGR